LYLIPFRLSKCILYFKYIFYCNLYFKYNLEVSSVLVAKTANLHFEQPFGDIGGEEHNGYSSVRAHWKARVRHPISNN